MITSFEVGAIFKIIDEASPGLRKILAQVRELRIALDKTKIAMSEFGAFKAPPGIGAAIKQTDDLAISWDAVTKNVRGAQAAMAKAAAEARGGFAISAAGGGNRGVFRPGARGGALAGGGAHIGGPGIPVPGGGHVRFGGGAGMATAAAFAWGIDRAAVTDDYVWRIEDISGLAHNDANHGRIRKILQDSQISTGFGLDEVGKSALSVVRLMQQTPGNGIDTLPEMLSSAATEARRKGTGLEESTTAALELAHQFRAYKPEQMKSLFATFAALSTADPRSLGSMTRAAGYAVPTLSELGVDPASVLLAGTGLAQAGVGSTKSGTWIREAVTRALPGIVLGHSASNKKHEEALRAMGLVDADGKPTWFTNGRPDELKMFEIAGDALQRMRPEERAVYGRAAFGAQGSGAVAVLGDPVVNARMHAIDNLRKSSAYRERYESFGKDYQSGSTMQSARTAVAEFNVTLGELARTTLPAVNVVLGNFKNVLEGIRGVLPGGDGKGAALVGGRAIEGALGGAAWGLFGGPLGVAGGALAGGVVGGVEGIAEQYMRNQKASQVITGNSVAQTAEAVHALANAIKGMPGKPGGVFAGGTSRVPQISLSLNLDGRLLGQAVSDQLVSRFDTQAPAFDGSSILGP